MTPKMIEFAGFQHHRRLFATDGDVDGDGRRMDKIYHSRDLSPFSFITITDVRFIVGARNVHCNTRFFQTQRRSLPTSASLWNIISLAGARVAST